MYIRNYHRRVNAVFLIFFLLLVFCAFRLVFIHFFRGNYLASLARKQHNLFIELEPRRGAIYDTNLRPQAFNVAVDSVYAAPNEIPEKDKDKIAGQLAPILNTEYAKLKDKLSRKKSFIWLARKISPQQANAIKELKIKGIGFIKESKRSYPNGYLLSHVIGFAGIDNLGLDGIELRLNNYLKGEPGWALFLRDARQKKLDIWEKMVSPRDGFDVILTIDDVIQYIAERELDKAFKATHAKGASIVVMNPHTGEILALANRPTFDLNEYPGAPKDYLRDRAITDMFEPGSVFKIVTASAAIEEGKVSEDEKVYCENGAYKIAGHILHDHQPHGTLTFTEVIEQSSNIGTCKIAQIVGAENIYRYEKKFGFGIKSGIDLPGEISGSVKEPRFWSKTSITAVPMGHEVGVTALQLANAVSAIANGGNLMRPYVVREIRDKFGEEIVSNEPVFVNKVMSLDSAARVRKMLIGVVEKGTGKLARIPQVTVAGKTGTAQKIEPNGTYSHDKFVATFIGFTPAEDPVLAIAVVIDEPRPYYFGGVVSAPVFKNVAMDALRYLKSREPLVILQN